MTIYQSLGVVPIVNAAGTLTRLGGSLMPEEVVAAMAEASRAFVDIEDLHLAAGRRIAKLVGAPAAHVCGSAAAGIALMAAACMAGTDPERVLRLPDTTGMRHRFIVLRSHRNPFDQALRVAGGTFVEVDADPAAVDAAIDDTTAAVYATCAWFCTGPVLSLEELARIAHRRGVPLIVDAAAEVPPVGNLRQILDWGVDLVAFSGGKAIRGPQASGFLLGRPELIEACRRNDSPHMAIGRPMKAGKEEIAGLVRAVELYVARDHAAELAGWERQVATMLAILEGIPGVRAWRQMPFGIGQQIPHVAVTWDEAALGLTHAEVAGRLLTGDPPIAVQLVTEARAAAPEIRLHPHTLGDGEAELVAGRVREVVSG